MAATCSGNLYGCRTTLPTDVNADSGAFPELCLTVCPVVLIRNMEVGTKQSHEIAPINSNLTSSHSATVQGRVKRRSQISVVSGVKRTHDALNFIGKQNPGLVIDAGATNSSEYVKYSKNTSERVIKLHEVAQDPLSPPKFRQKKTPLGRISPPKVVLHSPPRLLEEAERSQWNIPPAISNWKNSKGFTIPLDKRLAADGRGLHTTKISDNFAKLTEALYVAEKSSRDAVDLRAKLQAEIHSKAEQKNEESLRRVAMNIKEDILH